MSNLQVEEFLCELNSIPISTKPTSFKLKNGKTGIAWKVPRLTFKRSGISRLKSPEDLIVNEISTSLSSQKKEGYHPAILSSH